MGLRRSVTQANFSGRDLTDTMDRDNAVITVFSTKSHGIPSSNYVTALRERLPDTPVRHARTPAEKQDLTRDATVIAAQDLDESLLDHATNLELFACGAAGVSHLPLDAFESRDIVVTNASGVHASNMAEQTIGSLLMLLRSLEEGCRRTDRAEWRHYAPHGELAGSTVMVVGLGAVGTAIADRLAAFNVTVIGVRYTPSKGGPVDEVIGFETNEFHDALARTDHLLLATPLTETTRGLIGETEFSILPPSAIVVNVARGAVIETPALVNAIHRNAIHGAVLDVTDPEPLPADHPLWTFDNVVITPHNAGYTEQYWERRADILAENVRQLESAGPDATFRNQVV